MARSSGTRASDADRNTVVDALATAFSEGQLTQPEYEERSRAALQSPTLAELRSLTTDLQQSPTLVGEPDTVSLPPTHQDGSGRGIRVWPWIFRLITVAAVVGVAFFGFRVFSSIGDDDAESPSSQSANDQPSDADPVDAIPALEIPETPDMMTVAAMNRMIELMRDEIGSTVVNTLNIQDETASFSMQRRDVPGNYSYYYDGFLGVPSYNETSTDTGHHIDLADINIPAIMKLMDSLPERFDIDDATSRHISLDFGGYFGRGPSLDLYLSGPTRTGYLIASPTGKVIHVQPPS